MSYYDELTRAMEYLANPKSIFLGQAIRDKGTAMTNNFKKLIKKLIEMPVTEEMQLGITNGLLMNDYIPISIYPRMVFLF